jgi:hypothetical protein
MRTAVWTAVAGLLVAGAATAQPGPPAAIAPPVLPVPDRAPPPLEFGIGTPVGESVPTVRPPMPVTGAPIEVPPGPMFWAQADALFWRAKGGLVPPLVVGVYTSANPPLPADPRMAFPVSDDRINGDVQSGYRLRGGMWLDKPHGTGVEATYTNFLHASDRSIFLGNSNVILARPFVDTVQRTPALFQLSNSSAGFQGVAAVGTTFNADGFELNMLRRGPAMIGDEMHWVLGLRYWTLEESLAVETASQGGGLQVSAFDSFATRNRFFGPQVGGDWHWDRGRLSIDLTMKMAVGGMWEEAAIDGGSTVVLPSGARVDRTGGLLALRSNVGDYDRTKLALIRDTSLSLGYCIAPNVQLRLGYDFVWVTNVLRPGQQIDLGVNPTYLPFSSAPAGYPRPWYKFDGELFWMHGLSLGLSAQF